MQWRKHLFSLVSIMQYENSILELNYRYVGCQALWTLKSNFQEGLQINCFFLILDWEQRARFRNILKNNCWEVQSVPRSHMRRKEATETASTFFKGSLSLGPYCVVTKQTWVCIHQTLLQEDRCGWLYKRYLNTKDFWHSFSPNEFSRPVSQLSETIAIHDRGGR